MRQVYGVFLWIPSLSMLTGVIALLVAIMDVAINLYPELYQSAVTIIFTVMLLFCTLTLFYISNGIDMLVRERLIKRLRDDTLVTLSTMLPSVSSTDAEQRYKLVADVVLPKVENLRKCYALVAKERQMLEAY